MTIREPDTFFRDFEDMACNGVPWCAWGNGGKCGSCHRIASNTRIKTPFQVFDSVSYRSTWRGLRDTVYS